jgi:hypothetical protein
MINSVLCELRKVGNDFNPASVIWCRDKISAVAYVERIILLKVNQSKCTKQKDRAYSAFDRRVTLNMLDCIRPPSREEHVDATNWAALVDTD